MGFGSFAEDIFKRGAKKEEKGCGNRGRKVVEEEGKQAVKTSSRVGLKVGAGVAAVGLGAAVVDSRIDAAKKASCETTCLPPNWTEVQQDSTIAPEYRSGVRRRGRSHAALVPARVVTVPLIHPRM